MNSSTNGVISRRTVIKHVAAMAAISVSPSLMWAAPAGNGGGGDWPCFRGPNHNGISSDNLKLFPGGPKQMWEARVKSGHASMAIVGGRLYTFGTGADNLACLDATSGDVVWRRRLETHFGDSTPAVEGGRVFAIASLDGARNLGKNGHAIAYCCDAAKGEIIWKRQLAESGGDRQYGHAGSPLLWDEFVILNAGGGAAVKKANGEIAWAHPGFPGLATPVVFQFKNRAALAFFGGDRLIARDARGGQLLWEIPWKTSLAVNACDPIIFDNKIFVCSNYGRGRSQYDISGDQPRLLWEIKNGGHSFSTGFFHESNLYCLTTNSFARLDLNTGRPIWEDPGGGSATLIGDKLIRVQEDGKISIGPLTATGFRATITADAGMKDIKAPPGYSDGRIYLRNEQGRIVCLQVGDVV